MHRNLIIELDDISKVTEVDYFTDVWFVKCKPDGNYKYVSVSGKFPHTGNLSNDYLISILGKYGVIKK